MKPESLLGKRLLAALRLARWELQITNVVKGLLAQRLSALEAHLRANATTLVASPSGADPFDVAGWDAELTEALTPVLSGVSTDIYKDVAGDFVADNPKFLTAPGVLTRIDIEHRLDRVLDKMKGLGPDTSVALGRALTVGTNLGESIPKLSERVQSVFASSDVRATRIARTEVVGASNGVAHDTAGLLNNAGMPLTKVWLATDDDRTRDSHLEADGQEQPYDMPFDVGGCALMYPGDEDTACVEEIVNCRCTVTYYATDEATGEVIETDEDGEVIDDSADAGTLPAPEAWSWGDTDYWGGEGEMYDDDGEPVQAMLDLFDKFSPWKRALTYEESDAINSYTGPFYEPLNRALRQGLTLTDAQEAMVKNLTNAIDKAPALQDPMLVYRGMSMLTHLEGTGETSALNWARAAFPVGQTVQIDGFISTSPFTDFPLQAGGGARGVMMEIEARTGAFVDEISSNPGEGEWLMKHGSKFQVVHVVEHDGMTIVRLREIA